MSVQSIITPPPSPTFEEHFCSCDIDDAFLMMREKQFEKALGIIDSVLEEPPEDPQLYSDVTLLKISALHAIGFFEEAVGVLHAWSKRDPCRVSGLFNTYTKTSKVFCYRYREARKSYCETDYIKSLEHARNGLNLPTTNKNKKAWLHYIQAACLLELNRLNEVESAVDKGLALSKEVLSALNIDNQLDRTPPFQRIIELVKKFIPAH